MANIHDKRFPNESPEYRQERNALLQRELELRAEIEAVAEQRRQLLYTVFDKGDPRHVDMLWPLWNVLDLTPKGRGDFYPQLDYD